MRSAVLSALFAAVLAFAGFTEQASAVSGNFYVRNNSAKGIYVAYHVNVGIADSVFGSMTFNTTSTGWYYVAPHQTSTLGPGGNVYSLGNVWIAIQYEDNSGRWQYWKNPNDWHWFTLKAHFCGMQNGAITCKVPGLRGLQAPANSFDPATGAGIFFINQNLYQTLQNGNEPFFSQTTLSSETRFDWNG